MSTILDALKKSEQERKLDDVPTLSSLPTPEESSRWPIIITTSIIVLLLVGLAVFMYLWFLVPASAPASVTSEVVPVTNESIADTSNKNPNDDMVVNVVSFSEEASQRFVMINGKLFRQGEFVQAGVRVQEIKEDSVVLIKRGRRIVRKP